MIKGANKNPLATVRLCAYDALGDVVAQHEYYGRYEPSLLFLEFYMDTRTNYPKAVRFTLEVAL